MMGRQISGHKLKKLLTKEAILIDVRNPIAFRDGTIPGAINLPINNISQLVTYPKNSKIIFFGEDITDPNLKMALKYATQVFNDVMYIANKEEYFKAL